MKKNTAEGNTASPSPTVHKAVKDLPAELKDHVNEMLTQGATYEDIVEDLEEQGKDRITVNALRNHYRSNKLLQRARIQWHVQTTEDLKSALTDPQSADAALAEAVLFSGLMGLSRRSAASRMQEAIRVKGQKESARLKEEIFRLREEKLALDRQVLDARLRAEDAKLELLTGKIMQLKQAAERSGHDRVLGPEIIGQIREIYGLVSTPVSGATGPGAADA